MIVVVDANILFSALITPGNKLAKIISYAPWPTRLISGYYLNEELTKHHIKIVRLSKLHEKDVFELQRLYLGRITLYNETLINEKYWLEAENLTRGVDQFDVNYVALTLQTGGLLWTGDKKLASHLKAMGFERVVTTAELAALVNIG